MLPRGGVSAPGITTKARRAALAGAVLAVLMLGTEALAACAAAGDEIVVRVNQLRNGAGNVVAVLYGDNPDDFLKKGRKLAKVWAPAREGTVDVCLTAPRPGTYAVAVYHDENANVRFDKTWIGLPDEGYGISNNPRIFLAPPLFDEAKFEAMAGPTVIDIDIRY